MKHAVKWTVLIAGPIALIAGLWLTLGSADPIDDRRRLVNVLTGEIVSRDQRTLPAIPALDEAGRRSLYPVARTDTGAYVIPERFRKRLLDALERGEFAREEIRIDLETFSAGDRPVEGSAQ